MQSIPVPLKRYHIASGFGDKSVSWWPSGPACANSMLDEEVDDEYRHNDGPYPRTRPFQSWRTAFSRSTVLYDTSEYGHGMIIQLMRLEIQQMR